MSQQLKVFITYSHKNTAEKDKLITGLALLKREGIISIWHDNEILPGDKWRDAIFNNLADSDLLLYLTSTYSLESENCNKELAAALNAEIRVIPIILENCDWLNHQLSDFQALPDKGNPINKWQPESDGWQNVVDGIRRVLKKIQIQAASSSKISEKELHAEMDFQHGNILFLLGQLDMAIGAYSNAINLNPLNARVYNNRGIIYGRKGDLDNAIADFSKAVQLKPDYATPYYGRGIVYTKKGDFDNAIRDYTEAIEHKTDFAEAYNNRGNAYVDKGEVDNAISDFTKAIKLKPNLAEVYHNRGRAYTVKNDYANAIKDFTKAIQLKPGYAEAYSVRGVNYAEKGEFEKAIKDYNKAIELNPKFAGAYNNRGIVYFNKGDFDKAIEDYTTAIQQDSQLARAYYLRGEAWLCQKEWDKAKTDFITAKRLGVDIIAVFHNSYKDVETYQKNRLVKLPEDLALLLTQRRRTRYPKTQKVLDADGNPIKSSNVVNLREQLRNVGPPLSEYIKAKPAFGINTAPTEVFVVNKTTRSELIAAHPSSTDILKPFLHGRDLRRWHVDTPQQWLIFTHRGIAIDDYPAILKYLEKHNESLEKRKGKQKWYELQVSLRDVERFAQPKLVCPNTYNHQTFAVDTAGYYYDKTAYLIPTEEKWLCGLLNSRTVEWFYSQVSKQLTIDPLRARSGYIQQIPIPDLTSIQKALIAKIVDYLIYLQQQPTTDSKDLAHARDAVMLGYFERIIDGLVYESYLPEDLHKGDKHFFQPLLEEQLPLCEEIQGDKMPALRDIFEMLYERTHPIRRNLFFVDSVKPVRVIQGKL
ncbi:tetratricopeptide repeat protein [Candidatus Poribacteria bacterium]|nr:tetratricopeptide repeat protein [Candidatus Poribacteria bacterium]